MLVRTVRSCDFSDDDRRRLFERQASLTEIMPAVRAIMDEVRDGGDEALARLTERFDGARPAALEVSSEELEESVASVPADVQQALRAEVAAVTAFHRRQLPHEEAFEIAPGVMVSREWRPIQRIGLYVPGGRGAYPSSVVMLGVPASLAGCPEIVLCTPPEPDGGTPAVTLFAARLAGIRRVFKVGGAQAIAAMAFGTQSVPRVEKLFGAGNAYVTAAKLLAFPDVALDAPAGPSELLILADDSAEPAWIAADLLSDAEHGPESPAVLITTSRRLGERVVRELERQIARLPRAEIAREALEHWGLVVLVETLEEAVILANDYAPEHLEIITATPREVLAGIHNAGSIFLGSYAPNAAGDYATGTNHVLPTARFARMFSAVSVESFGRMVQCQELTREGLQGLSGTITTLARSEGLEGHARAVEERI